MLRKKEELYGSCRIRIRAPGCGKMARSVCTACLHVFFCNQECQRAAWKRHEKRCQKISDRQLTIRVVQTFDSLRFIPLRFLLPLQDRNPSPDGGETFQTAVQRFQKVRKVLGQIEKIIKIRGGGNADLQSISEEVVILKDKLKVFAELVQNHGISEAVARMEQLELID